MVWRVFYAGVLSWLQYYVWSHNEFSKLLLPPHQPIKYFLQYSWTHFWFNVVLVIASSFAFYLLLRFFEETEPELGFLCALIVGWPNFIVFAALAFILMILISFFRTIFLKKFHTAFTLPFLLAALAVLLFGSKLVDILGLGVFRI